VRVVFLGFQAWGCATLRALLAEPSLTVPLVVTHPPSRRGDERIWIESVERVARQAGVPVVACRRIVDPDVVGRIRDARPDFLVASNWRTIVSPDVVAIPRLGALNVHDGLLPGYGGFAPVNWAIVNGETRTGVTVHFMTPDVDLGDIVLQREIPIYEDDTAADVVRRGMPLCGELALRAVAAVRSGDYRPVRQDRARSTFYHRRSEADNEIDWGRPCRTVHDLVRAQADPYPNAFTVHRGERLRIKRTSLPDRPYCGTPGRVFARVERGVVVVCGPQPGEPNQGLVLEVVQPEGGEPLPALRYFRRMGERLG
jgi:methionyl-tRNA formyltransferase